MKKFIYTCLLLTILLVLNGCNNTKNTNKFIDANKGIKKIQMIASYPYALTKFTEDKEKIQEIVNYINDLDLKTTKEVGGSGGGYVITVYFDDTTYKEYCVVSEKYFVYEKYRYAITTEQAQKFKEFYYSLINSESK